MSKEEAMLLPGTLSFEDNDKPENYLKKPKQELFNDKIKAYEYDDFNNFRKRIENFENDLLIYKKILKICSTILFCTQ